MSWVYLNKCNARSLQQSMESLCNYPPGFSALSMKQSLEQDNLYKFREGHDFYYNYNNTWLFEGFYPNVSKPLFFTKRDKCNYHSSKVGKA